MHPRTAFRLAMLANGYWPLLDDCKRAIEPGWPYKVVDAAEVLSWDRSTLASTGLKIDGDLAIIDVDVSEANFVAALADAMRGALPRAVHARPGPACRRRQRSLDRAYRGAVQAASRHGAGTAAATRTIPRCPSTWSSASARWRRGSSPSTARIAETAEAR